MKRKVTKIIAVAIIAQVLLFVLFALFFCFNDLLLSNMTRSFRNGIRQSDAAVELLETDAICGKLNGNGNGMNYFGAALVRADSTEAMDTLASELKEDFETVGYTVVDGYALEIPYLEHGSLTFDYTDFQQNETYYCIYYYIHSHPASNIFDIRGY